MRRNTILAVPAFLFMAACSDFSEVEIKVDDLPSESSLLSGAELTVKASLGDDDKETRTVVASNGSSILWSPGDAINMFYGAGSAGKFTESSLTQPGSYAEFTGTLGVVTGSNESGTGSRSFWGVYPYNEANTCDGSSVIMTIPSAQDPAENTFANGLNPTVATGPGLDLIFYNVGSWFIFSVKSEGITSVTLKGNNGEDLVGKIRVSMDTEGHPSASVIEGGKSITMNAPEGGFTPGTLYYMVLLPQTLELGYTLTLSKGEMTAECVVSKSAEFVRSSYRRKKEADSGLEFKYNLEGNIDFADPAVKAICVENWDTDGDGELSYAEAAAVTTVPFGIFSNNKEITSFDEFRYFTGVTSLGYETESDEGTDYFGAFYNTSLKSIKLPTSLTTIAWGAFRGCSSLETLTIPNTVTRIQQVAFLGCTSLEIHMESETPCKLQGDGTYLDGDPCAFGFLTSGKVKAIYVPTEDAASVYRATQFWPSSLIHPEGWVDPSDVISFEDEIAELYCLENWDADGDGKLTKGEAAAVIDIGTVFQGKDMISFDELKYFTGISSLAANAFKDCKYLTSISFPSSLEECGAGIFTGCNKINKVTVPSLEMWIDVLSAQKPFYYSSGELYVGNELLTDLVLPIGYTEVGAYLCYNQRSLKSVTLRTGVTSIGAYAFFGCSRLTSVTFPSSMTTIGHYAFYYCKSLTEITIPSGITTLGDFSFSCTGLYSIKLPTSITALPTGIFADCSNLSEISPNEYKSIGKYALRGCGISSITVTGSIGESAFSGCKNLSSINLEEGLTAIYNSAFSGCVSLKEISLPKSLSVVCLGYRNSYTGSSYYGDGAFYDSSIEKIACYDTFLNEIGFSLGGQSGLSLLAAAFRSAYISGLKWNLKTTTTLKEVAVLRSNFGPTYKLPSYSFYNLSGLEKIYLPSGMTSIGSYAFYYCSSLVEYDFPTTLRGIEDYAFSNSGLKSAILPDGVQSLGYCVFYNCKSLTEVAIPSRVSIINVEEFQNCTSLQNLTILASKPPTLLSNALASTNNCTIYVPAGSVEAYKTASGWSTYASRIQAIEVVPVESASLDKPVLSLASGSTGQLTATVLPENAGDKTVSWTSSNPSAVSVDAKGNVSAVGEGAAIITATTNDGGFSASCYVNVVQTTNFNPESYLLYNKNRTVKWAGEDQYIYESVFSDIPKGSTVEMKMQLATSQSLGIRLVDDLFMTAASDFQFSSGDDDLASAFFSLNGLSYTDLLVLKLDGVNKIIDVNGNQGSWSRSTIGGAFLSGYERDHDEGTSYVYTGPPDGSKLYYAIVRDSSGATIMEGYPDKSVNPATNTVEYCWCWRSSDGTKTYDFAYGTSNPYCGVIY